MRDIYHQIVKSSPDFENLTDEKLSEARDLYASAAFSITSALTLIGNLAFDATTAEEYAGSDAHRDMVLLSTVLRNLPRMAQALSQSSEAADYVRSQRRRDKA